MDKLINGHFYLVDESGGDLSHIRSRASHRNWSNSRWSDSLKFIILKLELKNYSIIWKIEFSFFFFFNFLPDHRLLWLGQRRDPWVERMGPRNRDRDSFLMDWPVEYREDDLSNNSWNNQWEAKLSRVYHNNRSTKSRQAFQVGSIRSYSPSDM